MTSHFFTYLLSSILTIFVCASLPAQTLSLVCEEPTGCAPHGVVVLAVDSMGSPAIGTQWIITTPQGATLQSTANPYVAIFNSPGTYDFSVAVNGQVHLFEDYVTIYSKPVAQITTPDGQGCLPFCTALLDVSTPGSGVIVSRNWDFGDGTTSSEMNPIHCYEQTGVFTPVLAIEDENGCFASVAAPQLIHVTDNYPAASFTVGSQNSCYLPTAISFSATQTPDITSFEWRLNNVAIPGNNSAQAISFDAPGAYSVCMIAENAIGCRDTACQSLTISDEPQAQFTMDNDTICATQSISFTNVSMPQPTSTEWDFNGNGGIDGTLINETFNYPSPGVYTVSMTAHYGSTCSVTILDTVVVRFNPSINFTSTNLQSCAPPMESTFTCTEAFNPAYTYKWSVNGVLAGNGHELTYTFNEFGAYDIRLRRFTELGCERSRTKNDHVIIAAPELSFDCEELYCVGESLIVSNVSLTGNNTIIDYSWDINGDGTEDAIGANPNFIFDTPGEYFTILTVTSADGCVSVDTLDTPIMVLDNTIPAFSAPIVESCAGQAFIFCTTYNEDNTYTWDFHDGTAPQVMLAVDSCITHIYEDTGRFDVTLTVFNGACNRDITVEDYIHVVPPLALFEYDISCTDYAATFHNTSIEGDSLIWDFGDGSPLVINETDPIHLYAEPGQYQVTLTAYKTGMECFDTKIMNVSIALPSADITLTPAIGCAPLSVSLSGTSQNVRWDIAIENGDHITAAYEDNLISTGWNVEYTHAGVTTTSTSSSLEWPTLLFSEGGTFDVEVAVVDAFGCEAETTYTDAVVVWPGGNFSSLNASVVNACDNGGVTVHVEATHPSAVSWNWAFSDGSVSNAQMENHFFAPPFDYNSGLHCVLTATDANGCTSTQSVAFDAVLPPEAVFSASGESICRNGVVAFTNQSSGPQGTTYLWSFGDGIESNEPSSVEHIYSVNGNFTTCLTATNLGGCTVTSCAEQSVAVYSPIAEALYSTQLNTCLFAVTLTNNSQYGGDFAWWDFGDNQTGVGDTMLHTYPIGVYDVQLIVGTEVGCADTLIIPDILNYSSSVGPFSQVLDSANCAPFGVTLQAFNPNDQLFDYFWDFNDGNGDPLGGTITTHAYLEPGAYCPSIMMTDPNGCDVYIHCTDTIFVENYTAEILVPEHICLGDEAVIEIHHAESFEWNHPSVTLGANNFSLIAQADSSFLFDITTHYSDCEYTQHVEISALPLPVVSLALVDSLCSNAGDWALMGGYPEGGSYFVGGEGIDHLSTNHFSNEFALVDYAFVGSNGCSNRATDSIFVIAPPEVEPLSNRSFCDGDSALVWVQLPDSFYTVNGVVSSAFVPVYNGAPNNITLHVYDAFGCYNSASATYNVHALPTGVIDAPSICAQEELSVSTSANVAGATIASATWALDDGRMGNGLALQIAGFDAGGEHTIGFELRSTDGCTGVIDTTFMVFDNPIAQFESSIACEKDTTLLLDASTFGNDSIASWTWNFDNTTLSSVGDTMAIFANPGLTNVSLEVSTLHGCSNHVTRPITVRFAPIVQCTADNVCLGSTSVFQSQGNIPSGGVSERFWAIEHTPYTMVGEQAEYTFTEPGNYTYTFTAISNFGCETSQTDSIWVYPNPIIDVTEDELTFCAMQPISVSADASIADPSQISSYAWSIDGEPVASGNPAQFQLADIGAYVIDVAVMSNHGCEARTTFEQPVIVYPNPTAGFTWTLDQLSENPAVQLEANTSADVTTVSYNWGDGTSDGTDLHFYTTDGTYDITQVVTNSFGCNAYHSETIEAYNGLMFFVPDAFTPDQNNHNETFTPIVSGSFITHYVFRVFNRWGIELFTSIILGEGWDGTFQGEPSQDGAYNWSVDMIVRGRPELIVKRGSVLLLR